MEPIRVEATRRAGLGKTAARRMRDGTKVPAVAYGKGLATMPLSVSPSDVARILKSEYGENALVELQIDGKEKLTSLLRDFQLHPVSRHVLHADFIKVEPDQMLDIEIPLELVGKSVGVTAGGILDTVYRKIPVRCLPSDIPLKIVHDVTQLELLDMVAAKDLALPKGVSLRIPPERTVAGVFGKPAEEEEVAPAAAPGAPGAAPAAGAAAAGAAGAPAAGAAAPAAGADAKKAEGKKDKK
ncbi:MAG TPA: 50S ribosomal protein L25 [Polyangiaceae bacterium]|nr:50S ribosomal protein L25 [Polyangiaceae bacterium]